MLDKIKKIRAILRTPRLYTMYQRKSEQVKEALNQAEANG